MRNFKARGLGHRGYCYVCGKPTVLMIHRACSETVVDKAKEARRLKGAKKTQNGYKKQRPLPSWMYS